MISESIKPPATEFNGVTICELFRPVAARSMLLRLEDSCAAVTVAKPPSLNRRVMNCPERLFRHSGRTTADAFFVASQSTKPAIRLPPPWRMLSDIILMVIVRALYYIAKGQ